MKIVDRILIRVLWRKYSCEYQCVYSGNNYGFLRLLCWEGLFKHLQSNRVSIHQHIEQDSLLQSDYVYCILYVVIETVKLEVAFLCFTFIHMRNAELSGLIQCNPHRESAPSLCDYRQIIKVIHCWKQIFCCSIQFSQSLNILGMSQGALKNLNSKSFSFFGNNRCDN